MRRLPFWLRLIALLPLGLFIVFAQKLGFNPWNVNNDREGKS